VSRREALQDRPWEVRTIFDKAAKAHRRGGGELTFHWEVDVQLAGLALTDYLAGQLRLPPDQTRDLIDFGSVQVQGRQERNPRRVLAALEKVSVHVPWLGVQRHYEVNPGRVIYQDRFLLAYDKEAGVPSQQTPADAYNNLFAALARHLQKKTSHPYIALHHRLDRETSGVMVFALERSINRSLGKAFENKEVVKDYLAWMDGAPPEECWQVSADIGRQAGSYVAGPPGTGKPAQTAFRVLYQDEQQTLVWARPLTGRTHQIRLHARHCGHPLLGDRRYGGRAAPRLYLHAHRLVLAHPHTKTSLVLCAPLPPEWPLPPDWVLDLPVNLAQVAEPWSCEGSYSGRSRGGIA
jgi:23S rRNA pseudouridine1911/1915/1917 synthase